MSDKIEAGRQAWQRLQAHQRAAWADWRAVGEAIKIGKDAALLAANAKTPHGKIYTRIFGNWMRDNGLDEIRQAHRYRLLQCIENIASVEAWRAGLPERQRNRMNHPDSVWFGWRRAVDGTPGRKYSRPDRPPNHQSGKHVNGRCSRSIYFNQDMVRRGAMAMRENFSNDVYALARICLMAALRNENDLLELLPPEPKPPAPRRIAAPAALELSA